MSEVKRYSLDSPLSSGDCVTTYEAFGEPNAIVTSEGRFVANELVSFLKVLDLIVLYDKIGVITGVEGSHGRLWITPTQGLSLGVKEKLNQEGILAQASLKFTGPSPREYLEKYLSLSKELQMRLENDRTFVAEHKVGNPTIELSKRRLENDFEPLVIADEVAKGALPFSYQTKSMSDASGPNEWR